MSEEAEVLLQCAPWDEHCNAPYHDVRKATCSFCKREVAVSACNLPQISRDKIKIACIACCEKLRQDPANECTDRGINLPESGRFIPLKLEEMP
jgi:hypothetical protein